MPNSLFHYDRVAVVTELVDRRGGNGGFVITVYSPGAEKPGVKLSLTANSGYSAPKVGTRFKVHIEPENADEVLGRKPEEITGRNVYEKYRRACLNAPTWDALEPTDQRAWERFATEMKGQSR